MGAYSPKGGESARLCDPYGSRAVLIGAASYASDSLPDIPAVANNLSDLADALTNPHVGSLARESCTIVLDPDEPRTVGDVLSDTAESAVDTLLVYYSGHGLLDQHGELFFSLPTTIPGRPRHTAVPFAWVRHAFLETLAVNRVLILDCCYSGRAIEVMADDESAIPGQIEIAGTYTLTSAAGDQLSYAPAGARHTAFTAELLSLLGLGIPGGSEFLTLRDIYWHLRRTAAAKGSPKPLQRGTATSDSLAIARNPARSTSVL